MQTILLLTLLAASNYAWCQDLTLNDLEYFEKQGVNVLVYNNFLPEVLTMRRMPA